MSGAERDPREGRLEEADGRWRLRFERFLAHPPEKVWRALTREEHLAAWFPTTIEGELRAGAPLRFAFRGDAPYPASQGEVIECDAGRVLEFTWGMGDEDVSQPEQSRFELVAEGGGTRLTFMTTYDRVGKSARDAAGWHVCLDALEAHLEGLPQPDLPSDSRDPSGPWLGLERLYAGRFGPEAATMGPPAPGT